jgi:hypothetical protein
MRLNFVGPTIKHRDRNSHDNVSTGLRSLARGEQNRGQIEIQVRHKQSRLSIRLEAVQRAIGTSDRRSRSSALTGAVHRREVDRVFRRTAQDRLFTKTVSGIGKCCWTVTRRLGHIRVRMKDDLSPSTRCPTHRLGIAPASLHDRLQYQR